MPLQNLPGGRLKVAIIGAGPAGLGAAIEFSKLPFVDWNLYEQATAIREIGAGISIQPSTWRLLEVMGAAGNLTDIFRPEDNHQTQHRNGRTGEILISLNSPGVPYHQTHARTHRSTLQLALLKEVDQGHVRLSSKLARAERLSSGRIRITFQDGFTDDVDLLVGADGVRSVVRNFAFPKHRISYTGKTSYRVVVSSDEIGTIPGVPESVTFWHGPQGWLYTCPLGNSKFEITTMTREPDNNAEKVSWGQDATIEQNLKHFEDFAPLCKQIMSLPKEIKQYALFSGPRLDSIVAHGSVALVGDASHPLSGAFGAGAGFALEDVYVLTRAIAWAYEQSLTVQHGLEQLDRIRGPHYKKLYDTIDAAAKADSRLDKLNLNFDDRVQGMVDARYSNDQYSWIYNYDVQKVFQESVQLETSKRVHFEQHSRL